MIGVDLVEDPGADDAVLAILGRGQAVLPERGGQPLQQGGRQGHDLREEGD